MNYYSRKILEDRWISVLLDKAYCWNCHVKGDSSSLKTILYVMTGHLGSWNVEVKDLLRKYLHERGIKGVNRFKMPEIIAWCGCEPQRAEFRRFQRKFSGDPDILF